VLAHPLLVQEVPCSISGSCKGFDVVDFCFVVVVFLLFVQKYIICHNILQLLLLCLFIKYNVYLIYCKI